MIFLSLRILNVCNNKRMIAKEWKYFAQTHKKKTNSKKTRSRQVWHLRDTLPTRHAFLPCLPIPGIPLVFGIPLIDIESPLPLPIPIAIVIPIAAFPEPAGLDIGKPIPFNPSELATFMTKSRSCSFIPLNLFLAVSACSGELSSITTIPFDLPFFSSINLIVLIFPYPENKSSSSLSVVHWEENGRKKKKSKM